MITITVNKPFVGLIDKKEVINTIQTVIREMSIKANKSVNVVFGDDTLLQQLNRDYLGHDNPTDVLSFEATELDPATGETNLGDVIISYPTAEKQAVLAGHPVRSEILLLLVHGLLHLAGFDHDSPAAKKEMWQKQGALLETMNVEIKRISGDEDFHD